MSTKIIDRVNKMLALANDAAASQGERDNALRMAYATLAKYNLDESDLITQESRECVEMMGFPSPWARSVSQAISGLFFCNYFITRGGLSQFTHTFVGKASNAVTAQLISEYVIRSIRQEAGKAQRKGGFSSSYATSFCKGATATIRERCAEMKAAQTAATTSTGTGMVLTSMYASESLANAAFLRDVLNLKLTTSKSRQSRAGAGYTTGADYGKGISLSTQVRGNSQLAIGA